LERETSPLLVTADVGAVEDRVEGGLRLTLTGLTPPLPPKVRITVRTEHPPLAPGQRIETRAIFLPLPEPVVPGGYDFGRQLWFEGIGAVGFAVAPVAVVGEADETGLAVKVRAFRERLTARIRAVVPGAEGGVAAALITGIRDGIPETVNNSMRIAGLAHLLAISGLHMALVTGIVFFALRALLALWPKLALRYSIRKFAAAGALLAAAGYLILSGASVSTVRAFVMVSIVLLAVLTDRTAISLRLVTLAALFILAMNPEALLHPSFQMSFAAVVALVAAYQRLWPKILRLAGPDPGIAEKIRLYIFGVLLSTAIAEISIAPIAYFHFGRFSTFGLIANIGAVPVTGFWVMPAGLLALVLYPFGLDAWAWKAMGVGVKVILEIAATVAAWPYADVLIPAMPLAALVLIVLGGLSICLWRAPSLRVSGAAFIAAGALVFALDRPPDVLVDREGRLVALRDGSGLYYFSTLQSAGFTRDNWQRHYGQKEAPTLFALEEGGSLSCDLLGCVWKAPGGLDVALPQTPEALLEDCRHAGLVITREYAPFSCKDAKPVIDRALTKRQGAAAVWLEGTSAKIRTVGEGRMRRPW
ncbi:MAG TPA: ComEC/Rec2 family competence protein, partial [Sphingomonadales bacterium]|nr:ComEC/Rec2 family competence protein [Sphingomonadales bacterium]